MNVDNNLIRNNEWQNFGSMKKVEKKDELFNVNAEVNRGTDSHLAAIYTPGKTDAVLRNEDGAVIRKTLLGGAYENENYQSKMSSMGFYSGPIDGNLSSEMSKAAIKKFQMVYGLIDSSTPSQNVGVFNATTKNKFDSVYAAYDSVYRSSELATLTRNSSYKYDADERKNFALTWAFLKEGMNLNSKQASAIMGNMHAESNMSSDNASGYKGHHNPKYNFKVDDKVAYGLIQWRSKDRKQGLLDTATELGVRTSDVNAQLKWLSKEATGSEKKAWRKFLNAGDDLDNLTETFRSQFERSGGSDIENRKRFASDIYELFKNF